MLDRLSVLTCRTWVSLLVLQNDFRGPETQAKFYVDLCWTKGGTTTTSSKQLTSCLTTAMPQSFLYTGWRHILVDIYRLWNPLTFQKSAVVSVVWHLVTNEEQLKVLAEAEKDINSEWCVNSQLMSEAIILLPPPLINTYWPANLFWFRYWAL